MSDNNPSDNIIPMAAVTILLIVNFIALLSVASDRNNLKKDAVKRGYATWQVAEDGYAKFKWNENK